MCGCETFAKRADVSRAYNFFGGHARSERFLWERWLEIGGTLIVM